MWFEEVKLPAKSENRQYYFLIHFQCSCQNRWQTWTTLLWLLLDYHFRNIYYWDIRWLHVGFSSSCLFNSKRVCEKHVRSSTYYKFILHIFIQYEVVCFSVEWSDIISGSFFYFFIFIIFIFLFIFFSICKHYSIREVRIIYHIMHTSTSAKWRCIVAF